MYKDENEPDITVEVFRSEFPKCARCYKKVESVDKDPVFPAICHRCASEMHTMFYDLNYGFHYALPPGVTQNVDEFIKKYTRLHLHGKTWQEIQDECGDYKIPSDVPTLKITL